MKLFRACFLFLCSVLFTGQLLAETFTVSDIRIEGLQRVSAGSVFAALPINVNEPVDSRRLSVAIRALFETGNFEDIKFARDDDVLVIIVQERPSISEINLEGNKALQTEQLLDAMKSQGLAEGKVLKRSTLEVMRRELKRQYVAQGRYDATIEAEITEEARNRVAVDITIDEGSVARIKHINIVGNTRFDNEELLEQFELQSSGWFTWLNGNDKYAKQKLESDLEKLEAYYRDQGYLLFNIDSTQVAISPERDAVFITINVTEGDVYQVGEIELSGDIVLSEAEIRRLVLLQEGKQFSQVLLTRSEEFIVQRLGNDGYYFAEVKSSTTPDKENKTVDIKLSVNPGVKTYVRRIEFRGNTKTADEVLRREMRQMEGAVANNQYIEQSKTRLERLGYFKEVNVETPEVPGLDDQIDVLYSVEEQPSGSIGASVGFSQDAGVVLGANVQQSNFFGTGNRVGFGVNKSDYRTTVNFNYTNPYYTIDGVSRGFSVFYRETDLSEVNISSYSTDTLGGAVSFGYPIRETERLGFSFGYAHTEITTGFAAAQEIISSPQIGGVDTFVWRPGASIFDPSPSTIQPPDDVYQLGFFDNAGLDPYPLTEPGFIDIHGDTFENFSVTLSWSQSVLNRGRLPTRGYSQRASVEMTVPGSDLDYYKLTWEGQRFFPLTENLTLRLKGELGYGDGFGDTEELPFFEHFFAGGFGSVRGYRSNTLGPRSSPPRIFLTDFATELDTSTPNGDGVSDADGDGNCDLDLNGDCIILYTLSDDLNYIYNGSELLYFTDSGNNDPFGGNILSVGTAEILFPLPFVKDQRSVRSALFVDGGNVFSTNCRSTQLNCSEFDSNEFRYSWGLGLTWITGFGPLTFSFSRPLNEQDSDKTEFFQFSLGTGF